MKYCYQCDKATEWLAPDSRCGDCTRLTPEEVQGTASPFSWGFTGCQASREELLNYVGKGWWPLVNQLLDDLLELGWDGAVYQVKEKFGGLRFYIGEGSDEIHERIQQAEDESYSVCKVTGKPGKLRSDLGWMRTLCDEEYEKVKKEKYDV